MTKPKTEKMAKKRVAKKREASTPPEFQHRFGEVSGPAFLGSALGTVAGGFINKYLPGLFVKFKVSVRWFDGYFEEFEASEAQANASFILLRLTNNKSRHIPLHQVRWFMIEEKEKNKGG